MLGSLQKPLHDSFQRHLPKTLEVQAFLFVVCMILVLIMAKIILFP